jgi:hypothetical protein
MGGAADDHGDGTHFAAASATEGGDGMDRSPRSGRGGDEPNDTPGQPGQPVRGEEPDGSRLPVGRYLMEVLYGIGGVIVLLGWLLTRLASHQTGASFTSHIAQPYVVVGVAIFGIRALIREQLRWCRNCRRYRALEWTGERVLRRRPFRQVRIVHTETFNPRGERISTARQRSTQRAVREWIAVERSCRYCGDVRLFREMRDK